jgi:hypothetical protein
VLDQRFTPEAAPAAGLAASGGASFVEEGLGEPISLLASTGPGKDIAEVLVSPGVRVVFEDVPAIAIFYPSDLTVAINTRWQSADPRVLAAVLAHEGSHLDDFLQGTDMTSPMGCLNTERVAFERQAAVWRAFYGPEGKARPTSDLDRELNLILAQVTADRQAFAGSLAITYGAECGL